MSCHVGSVQTCFHRQRYGYRHKSTESASAPVQLPTPPAVQPTSDVLTPRETLKAISDATLVRGRRDFATIFTSNVFGGAFLGFGGALYVTIAGGSPAWAAATPGVHKVATAAVFPCGLAMIHFTGTDLLTGNFFSYTLPFLTAPEENNANGGFANLGRVWLASFTGNFAGSLAMAGAMAGLVFTDPTGAPEMWIAKVATAKCSLPIHVAFSKAMFANWLVNVAIFMATANRSGAGKIMAMWLPITTFVALGLEHCVANMFLLPLGMFCGGDITWSNILLDNILPVAAGNGVGAMAFCTVLPWYLSKQQ